MVYHRADMQRQTVIYDHIHTYSQLRVTKYCVACPRWKAQGRCGDYLLRGLFLHMNKISDMYLHITVFNGACACFVRPPASIPCFLFGNFYDKILKTKAIKKTGGQMRRQCAVQCKRDHTSPNLNHKVPEWQQVRAPPKTHPQYHQHQ